MSSHPNVLLILTLTPDNLARKTYRNILLECGIQDGQDDDIKVNEISYHHYVAESDYNDGWQVSAPEGSIVLLDLVTYGYGESISWDSLEAQKKALENWASDICAKHNCSFDIKVSANFW